LLEQNLLEQNLLEQNLLEQSLLEQNLLEQNLLEHISSRHLQNLDDFAHDVAAVELWEREGPRELRQKGEERRQDVGDGQVQNEKVHPGHFRPETGANVFMITIFGDFCQFSAKKLAFFSKTIVMINFFCKS
jgi:hypothetical protein